MINFKLDFSPLVSIEDVLNIMFKKRNAKNNSQ
jgi:hypothetical protein